MLTVGVPADVTGIYPHVLNESFTEEVNSNAFEGLTRFDHDMRPQPAVAERWENPDDNTWIFTLRGGLRFSDGTEVRAEDVVASIRHARQSLATRHVLTAISAAEAAGPRQVVIRTRTAAPTLLNVLAHVFVLPEAALGQPRDARPPFPAGTGVYAVEAWTPGRELVLRRNRHYRGAPAPFDEIRLAVIPDETLRAQALREGRIQLAEGLALPTLQKLASAPGVRVVTRPALRVLFLGLRHDRPPFSDARVREAFDRALDRRELIARALDGHGTPATQVVPPSVSGYNPQLTLPQPDPVRARALLQAAGWDGRAVRLYGPSNRYVNGTEILHEVARQLREVGVVVEVAALDKERFFALLGAPELELFLYGWSCGGDDAGNALGSLLRTPTASGLGYENVHGFSDWVLDALIDAALAAPALGRRRELLAEALARAAELRPLLPLLVQHESIALGPAVTWDPPVDMSLRLHAARPARPSPPAASS